MGNKSYMPTRESDQLAVCQNLVAVVGANMPGYKVSVELMDEFSAAVTAAAAALATVQNQTTRTKVTIAEKNEKMEAMRRLARAVVGIVQFTPGVTDAMKLAAGVTVRAQPSRHPAPIVKPIVVVNRVEDRRVYIQLRGDENTRAKPRFCTGAVVFSHVGETAPASVHEWDFAATVTRTDVVLPFPPSETGDTAWISAFWQNGKGESGPASQPIRINLPAASVVPTETEEAA